MVGWASRPFFLDGRDAHPTFKSGSYLILIPNWKHTAYSMYMWYT